MTGPQRKRRKAQILKILTVVFAVGIMSGSVWLLDYLKNGDVTSWLIGLLVGVVAVWLILGEPKS